MLHSELWDSSLTCATLQALGYLLLTLALCYTSDFGVTAVDMALELCYTSGLGVTDVDMALGLCYTSDIGVTDVGMTLGLRFTPKTATLRALRQLLGDSTPTGIL